MYVCGVGWDGYLLQRKASITIIQKLIFSTFVMKENKNILKGFAIITRVWDFKEKRLEIEGYSLLEINDNSTVMFI